jgi:hypothetical protein
MLRQAAPCPGAPATSMPPPWKARVEFQPQAARTAQRKIIGSDIIGWTVDGLTVDTNRDAIDTHASQDVTVRRSVRRTADGEAQLHPDRDGELSQVRHGRRGDVAHRPSNGLMA